MNYLTYQLPKKRKENKDMHIHSESSSKHVLCVFWQLQLVTRLGLLHEIELRTSISCSDIFYFTPKKRGLEGVELR